MPDRALLLGINNYLAAEQLFGCVNDVANVQGVLVDVFGFQPENVHTHVDDAVTKDVVREELEWLKDGARPGDRLLFHFSGHGSFTVDVSGDEPDDELICLYDMDFGNPDTYFLDDELGEFAAELPDGVQLVYILDSCHSGSGTRMMLAPEFNVEILRRERFLPPPPEILGRLVGRDISAPSRVFVRMDEKHVLLSACRDDQSAKDATIEGRPAGAFSHFLCKALREGGRELDRQQLISRLDEELQTFRQSPQLEAASSEGPLFTLSSGIGPISVPAQPIPPVIAGASVAPPDVEAAVVHLLKFLDGLSAEDRSRALRIAEQLLEIGASRRDARPRGARSLVTVHGICRHVEGFSDPWWTALQPHTTVFGSGARKETRFEVIWSDLVNARALATATGGTRSLQHELVAAELRLELVRRAESQVIHPAPKAASGEPTRDASPVDRGLSIPLLNCIDDFTVYMTNDAVRRQIIQRFTNVVGPRLAAGEELDIIAHSWGTVVAYEGLRELDAAGHSGRVRSFFTVGSALAILVVKTRLRAANQDGRKPASVRRWINLNAARDPIGGRLKGQPFQVDDEFLNLRPVACGFFDLGCAHGSYFNAANLAVNRDIFARFING